MKKIYIVIFALVFLFVGYKVFNKNYQNLLISTEKGLAVGKSYGTLVNQSDCLYPLETKYKDCNGIACELSANGFIVGCMETAKKDEFCTKLPKVEDTGDSVVWVTSTCDELKLGDTKCSKYLHKFISVCTEQIENRKRTTAELFQDGFKKGIARKQLSGSSQYDR